jgi:hypothetical protein
MNALDKLGFAIANAGITWTPEMRNAYEQGIKEFEQQFKYTEAEVEAHIQAAIEATKEKAIAALQGVATGRLDVVEAIRSME